MIRNGQLGKDAKIFSAFVFEALSTLFVPSRQVMIAQVFLT
jgi:hypothetical protein